MPAIISIESRDIFFITEFSFKELKMICDAMDMVTVDFDATIPEQVEAKDYFVGDFYLFIKEIVEKYENVESNNK
jgi:hypothetical protein